MTLSAKKIYATARKRVTFCRWSIVSEGDVSLCDIGWPLLVNGVRVFSLTREAKDINQPSLYLRI